jgi:hypothetical protein
MDTIIDLLRNLWNLLACIDELLGHPTARSQTASAEL